MKYLFIHLLFIINFSVAQNLSFNTTYGAAHFEEAKSITLTSDNFYLLVGHSKSFNLIGDTDILLVKTNNKGDTIWSKVYGANGFEYPTKIIEDNDGNYVISGYSNDSLTGDLDLFILKTNKDGVLLWSKKVGGVGYEKSFGMIQSTLGKYILFGLTTSYGYGALMGFASGYVVSFDTNGNFLWSKNYGDNEWDKINDISNTLDGGFIMTGWTESFGAGLADMFLIKTNNIGDVEWFYVYGTIENEEGRKVKQLPDSSFVVGGMSDFTYGRVDMFISKIDKEGNLIWTKVYGDNNDDQLTFLDVSSNQNIFFGGFKEDSLGSDIDAVVFKTDQNGDTLIVKHYGLDSLTLQKGLKHLGHIDIVNDFVLNTDQSITFCGSIESLNNLTEFSMFKTDTNLDLECQQFDKRIKYKSVAFLSDTDEISVGYGSIVMNGNIVERNGSIISNLTCKSEVIEKSIAKNSIIELLIFPNPFREAITLEFPYKMDAKVSVFDLFGNKIEELLIKEKTKHITMKSYNKGLYIVEIFLSKSEEFHYYKIIKE